MQYQEQSTSVLDDAKHQALNNTTPSPTLISQNLQSPRNILPALRSGTAAKASNALIPPPVLVDDGA